MSWCRVQTTLMHSDVVHSLARVLARSGAWQTPYARFCLLATSVNDPSDNIVSDITLDGPAVVVALHLIRLLDAKNKHKLLCSILEKAALTSVDCADAVCLERFANDLSKTDMSRSEQQKLTSLVYLSRSNRPIFVASSFLDCPLWPMSSAEGESGLPKSDRLQDPESNAKAEDLSIFSLVSSDSLHVIDTSQIDGFVERQPALTRSVARPKPGQVRRHSKQSRKPSKSQRPFSFWMLIRYLFHRGSQTR